MRTMGGHRIVPFLAVAVVLTLTVSCSGPPPSSSHETRRLAEIEDLLESDALSEELWPGWEVSSTPVALYDLDDVCYLLGHPRPPAPFERVRENVGVLRTVYRAELPAESFDPESGLLGGVPTAFIRLDGRRSTGAPAVFREAFRAYLAGLCDASPDPVNLVTGYPLDPRTQALADIECLVLAEALSAPDDSVAAKAGEFVSIRCHRRILLPPRFTEFERAIEYRDGIPYYIADRCSGETSAGRPRFAEEPDGSTDLAKKLVSRSDRAWYAEERFACTGAAVCRLLDRLLPGWKSDLAGRCVDPYTLLWSYTRGQVGGAGDALARHGFDELVAAKQQIVDESKSDAEKLFEKLMDETEHQFRFRVNLLASATVSFDPENIEKVDEYREVHTRILKIEYSGGTHIHIAGRPTALVLGEGEFDFQELVCQAPDSYTVTLDGRPYTLDEGIHHIDGEFSLESLGISLYARSAVVMVGEAGVTFILHR